MAGGGRGCPEGENEQARTFQWERKEAKADVDSSARETVFGSLLCRTAPAIIREDSGHSRKVGPEKERCAGMVLQPKTKTKAVEIFGGPLMDTGVVFGLNLGTKEHTHKHRFRSAFDTGYFQSGVATDKYDSYTVLCSLIIPPIYFHKTGECEVCKRQVI